MLLYDSPVSGNCFKVRLLLAHLAIPYERLTVDVAHRSNRPELLGELNPALRVPTLVLDDGRPLAESGAILWYFGEGTRFVPSGRYERAQVLQWMFFEQYDHEPAIAVVRFWTAYSGRPEAFADRLEERTATGHRALAAMERHLAEREFVVADELSLADIALYAYTHVAPEGGFDLGRYPAVRAWLDRIGAVRVHGEQRVASAVHEHRVVRVARRARGPAAVRRPAVGGIRDAVGEVQLPRVHHAAS